ncbi:MAG: DUF4340 domain-containing protein [Acidobacteria bacterium]|nr:DUF4340 domain-containing protein [Acidobacteriota bacterium]
MRGSRSLLVLLVVALGLGAYIYFVESKRDTTDPSLKRDKVFALEPGKIDEVEIHAASGEITTLKKNGDDWQMAAPVSTAADAGTVSSLVSSLETLEKQKTLEEHPSSVTPFGLQPARITVTFRVAGDSSPRRLLIGNKTPTGADLYAQVEGSPAVFLISAYLEDTFSRSTFDLRDKSVLKFSRDAVDTIRLEPAAGPAVTLARKGTDWRVSQPVDVRADFLAVDAILNRVSQGQMKAIVAGDAAPPSAADLKKFGLDRPQLVATFGAGSNKAALAIGANQDGGSVYARDLSRPLVFTVDASVLTDMKKTPADLRVKDVFEFKSFNARSFELTRGGATYAFEKTTAAQGTEAAADSWKQTKPAAKDMNTTGVTDLLNAWSSLRAESFTDRPLASGEDVVVGVTFGDATPPDAERVTFRKSGDVVHALRAGEPGAAVIPVAEYQKALIQFNELTGTK